MNVRGFFRAVKVESAKPPYDTIHLKLLYPTTDAADNLPADPAPTGFPVVIFFGGINCEPLMYHWLAVELAQCGLVVVTFAWVGENIPGVISLTPGVDLTMWKPANYGTAPTATALPTLIAELEYLQSHGTLAGKLNLQQIILGGHSAGGRIALENADPRFYPQVRAAFAYGVHTAAPVSMGFGPGTILPLPSSQPLLLMGGTCDGVIAASSSQYGIENGNATTSIVRTYNEAIAGGQDHTYLVLLEGANHFAIANPLDPTTNSANLDLPATQPEAQIRSLIGEVVSLFIDAHVLNNLEAFHELNYLLSSTNSLVASFKRK